MYECVFLKVRREERAGFEETAGGWCVLKGSCFNFQRWNISGTQTNLDRERERRKKRKRESTREIARDRERKREGARER